MTGLAQARHFRSLPFSAILMRRSAGLIDARGARRGAQEFDAAGRQIDQAGRRIDQSLRGIDGSFDRLKTSAASARTAMSAFVGGLVESGGFYAAQIRSPEARLRYYRGRLDEIYR